MSDELKHYGILRRSGRYPWGSGGNAYQRSNTFLDMVNDLRAQGLSRTEIAKGMGLTSTDYVAANSMAKFEQRAGDRAQVIRLKDKGLSNVAIGKQMGKNESSIRSLLNPVLNERSNMTKNTADILKDNLKKHEFIDVGIGVERHMGISRSRLQVAVAMLKDEGYKVYYIPVEQLGTGKQTSILTVANADVSWSDVYNNKEKIGLVNHTTEDSGRTFRGLQPVQSLDPKRLSVVYKEDGGADKDGVIELRPGVSDISLGNARYAQVRIGVDGNKFLKGMAMYADDLPDGVDVRFNTNKSNKVPKLETLKPMKLNADGTIDTDNPFGTTIKGEQELQLAQRFYTDAKGKKHISKINIVNEEGDWDKWSSSLSSQVLSKQNPETAKKQLKLAYDIKKQEYDEVLALTNPVIKKRLLEAMADDADAAAVHLKAAGLPRQATRVILPVPQLKETEIHAPTFRDGESVALIRYPHGGKFEIPELTVNNRSSAGKKRIGMATDAVGINPKVAERLSGADFDGDTVLVIPNNKKQIKSMAPLKGLKNFDPQESYPHQDGMKIMTTTNLQMGNISNLITDMTIKKATPSELARAVRHSMVVIDAEKHKLNYKQSEIDNGIAALKTKYQGGANRGASTLVSRASSEKRVPHRTEGKIMKDPVTGKTKRFYVDPATGKKLYETTGESYTNSKGKVIKRTTESTKMFEAADAFSLSSGTPMEKVYAEHANKLKALGNQSRKEALAIKPRPYSASAKKTYAPEVDALTSKLNIALKNAPIERQAQLFANKVVDEKRKANPAMDSDDIKKVKGQALVEARLRTGAKKIQVDITPKEWEAIQAGAISTSLLKSILDNADLDRVKELATPRQTQTLPTAKINKARSMMKNGYTQAEIADHLGVSPNLLTGI